MMPYTLQNLSSAMNELDEFYITKLSKLTYGLSPAGFVQLFAEWQSQLALCPGRISSLTLFPSMKLLSKLMQSCSPENPNCSNDPRFSAESWKIFPWSSYVEAFHNAEEFWNLATKNIPGQSKQTERAVSFIARQVLDAVAPSNFIPTNPELLFETFRSGGMNLLQGSINAYEDFLQNINEQPNGNGKFKVGENLAVTKGKVVFKNDLMELIQYEPVTTKVFKEPILILPAWIMKYYILDLSPENSLVKWLVEQGHTVFMVSWKNPNGNDRDKGMDDYVRDGALAAIEVVSSISEAQIHLVGYCLGGTLAMITSALLAHDQAKRLKSLSLFAAQGDFTEAGEMMVFITPTEVDYLKK